MSLLVWWGWSTTNPETTSLWVLAVEFGPNLFVYAWLASPAAIVSLQKKKIINFLLGSHKADGHHGLGNSKPDGTVKVVAEGWSCSPTYQLCYRNRVYSVGGHYLYLLVNYGPQNAKWVWLQPQSTAWLLWPQLWVSQAEPCSPPSYKRALCAFSPALLKLCTSQLLHCPAPCLSLIASSHANACDSAGLSFNYLELFAINQDTYHSPPAICSPPFLTSLELCSSPTCHLVACLMESITRAMLLHSHHWSSLLR